MIRDFLSDNTSVSNNRWPRMFPISGQNPGGGNDTLWLNLKIHKLVEQTLDARNKGGITVSVNEVDNMSFLMPIKFEETLNHNWEEHEGIISRMADQFRSLDTNWQEAKALASTTGSEDLAGARDKLAAATVSKIKPDTPLIYRGSSRRELPITFELADQGDPVKDVWDPVQRLREYSSPEHSGDQFNIEFPYVFFLQTVTGNGLPIPLLTMRRAVLRSVQPSFEGPYRDGYPSRCELTLTFVDMEHVYKDTFKIDPRVTGTMKQG